jgi:hypothetical protein
MSKIKLRKVTAVTRFFPVYFKPAMGAGGGSPEKKNGPIHRIGP